MLRTTVARIHCWPTEGWLHLFILLLWVVPCTLTAQTKKINALKNQKAQIEKGIKRDQSELSQTRHDVGKKEQGIGFIEDQLQSRLDYIRRLETDMSRLDREVDTLQKEVEQLETQLNEKKQKYKQSLRYARISLSSRSPLLFICSAKSFPQLHRRMRYAREYASFQKMLGIQVMNKQQQLQAKQNQLLATKQELSGVVQEVIHQRKQLYSRHTIEKANVAKLQQKAKEISRRVAEQQKQLSALNKKIDELVAYEIEQARKRAEAARRAEAERKKREAEARNKQNSKAGKSTGGKGSAEKTTTPPPSKWLTAKDQQLNGNFEHNKGRLPVPLTGPYRIASHFGIYKVPGLANVTLDNKGTNYVGQAGARARAIFDGEVSAVFQFGSTKNVLIRHGSYISVYCNLSSTIVNRGQQVKARDIIGSIADDGQGNYILHFQLRKETAKLNPEAWIGR